jgi:hypothetical protein
MIDPRKVTKESVRDYRAGNPDNGVVPRCQSASDRHRIEFSIYVKYFDLESTLRLSKLQSRYNWT